MYKMNFKKLLLKTRNLLSIFKRRGLLSASELVDKSLFDTEWYLKTNPDVANAGVDALDHYILHGWQEGRNPNPLFLSNWFLKQLDESSVCPLDIYSNNIHDQLNPHPLFDNEWYLNEHRSQLHLSDTPLSHYFKNRKNGYVAPSPLYVTEDGLLESIPSKYRYVVRTSPILAQVPPVKFLESYVSKGNVRFQKPATLDVLQRMSVLDMDAIRTPLAESDLRLIGTMDFQKSFLATKYITLPQTELISIIMPTKNRANMIVDAICSVKAQSYKHWELIICDDGGSDHTSEIVKDFADSRILYFRNDVSVGGGQARNLALQRATGSVIAYLDDDDLWDPHYLLISLCYMREHGARMAYSAQMVWDGFNEITRIGENFGCVRYNEFNRSLLENKNFISMIAAVHERELLEEIGGFDSNLKRLIDWDLFLRMTELTTPKNVPCILSHYFAGRDDKSITYSNSLEENYRKINRKLAMRSSWSEADDNVTSGMLYGLSSLIIERRADKLSTLPSPPRISILIPNYEAYDCLERCVESIYRQTTLPFDILIVDNNSSLETRSHIEQLVSRTPSTRWIREDHYQGFTYAVNTGLRELKSSCDLVVILNNDTIVTPNWLEELYFVNHYYPEAGMVVPRHVMPVCNDITLAHVPRSVDYSEVDINLSVHHANVLNPSFSLRDSLIELSFAPLFCGMLKISDLETLGYLDARNGPHYRSDWILSLVLRSLLQKKIIYTPFSKVYHMQGISSALNKGKYGRIDTRKELNN